MAIGLRQRTRLSPKAAQESKEIQKTDERMKQALRAQASQVCSASPREVQHILAKLEQRGDIVQDISPEEEDIPLEAEDDTYDAEWDYSDEDAAYDGDDDDVDTISGKSPYLSDNVYVIKIHRLLAGRVEFELPDVGWEGFRGVSELGKRTLGDLAKRGMAYRAIVRWLVESDVARTAQSPDEFLERHHKVAQNQFLTDWLLGAKISTSSFSKYLNCARLVWCDGSIPLRELFL